MSEQNLLVNLVKKSVGLPTGESSCCGTVASQVSQKAANACDGAQSVDSEKGNASCCPEVAPQVAQVKPQEGERCTDTCTCNASQ